MEKVDQVADAAADEVQAATDYALDAVGKFKDQAADIRRTADDILSQLGQTSNMPPPPRPEPPKTPLPTAAGLNGSGAPEAAVQASTADMLPEVKLSG